MALTDYTVLGLAAPDLTEAEFVAILQKAGSPALAAASAVWNYCRRRGVSPAFLLAMFKHESRFGLLGTATQTHSWGNTRLPVHGGVPSLGTVPGRSGVFPVFANWVDGGISTAARFLDHPPYAGQSTVRGIIPIWAPPTDNNDTEAYIKAVLASIEEWTGGTVTLGKPTVNTKHPSPNRGYATGTHRADAIIWHITQGTNSLGWLTNPASGASSNYLIARAGTIYELVPPTESAWANGRLCNPDADRSIPLIAKWQSERVNFNQRTISIEHEGFTSKGKGGSLTRAQIEATVRLTAWLCQEFDIAPDEAHIFGHFEIDACDRPNCPGFSAAEWTDWRGRVVKALVGLAPPPMLDPVVTPTRNWGGKGRLIAQTVTVVNDDTGVYYEGKVEYRAEGEVQLPWREV